MKKRMSNIELLRIFAMFMIISYHIAIHSGFDFELNTLTLNRLWIQFISTGGQIGVNLFVMISGYYLINSNGIKIDKLLKLWFQIFLYSVIFYFLFVIFGMEDFSIKTLIKCLFPITFNQWWFASTYMVLYLISPFVNKLLLSLDKKTYIKMLLLLTVIWVFIPTFTNQDMESNNLLWFVYLYSLSGYIRLHNVRDTGKSELYLKICCGLYILNFVFTIIFDIVGIKMLFVSEHATYLFIRNKIPTIFISLFLFLGFLNLDMKKHKLINFTAASTFGIYLIHDNNYIRPFLWRNLFDVANFEESYFLVLYTIFDIILVFVVCSLIEALRIKFFENYYMRYINKISDYINGFINKKMDYLLKYLNDSEN